MFTHQSVHAQSCGGSTSPWQHTLDTQCTCRSSRQSPWQRLRSTKRIWTWAPGRKSSPERTSSWTDEQSRRQGGRGERERERESEWVFGSTSGSMRSEASSWVSSGGSEGHRPGSQTGNTWGRTWKEGWRFKLMWWRQTKCAHAHTCNITVSYIVRIGATMSRDAMRIPSSAIRAVSSRAHVGSPLAFPWPNTCQKHTEFKYTHADPASHV